MGLPTLLEIPLSQQKKLGEFNKKARSLPGNVSTL